MTTMIPIAATMRGPDYRDRIQTAEEILGCMGSTNVWLFEPGG